MISNITESEKRKQKNMWTYLSWFGLSALSTAGAASNGSNSRIGIGIAISGALGTGGKAVRRGVCSGFSLRRCVSELKDFLLTIREST